MTKLTYTFKKVYKKENNCDFNIFRNTKQPTSLNRIKFFVRPEAIQPTTANYLNANMKK